MASAKPSSLTSDIYRQAQDKVASTVVTAGGLAVLMALLLIVFYLFWVVWPLFTSPYAKFQQAIPIEVEAKTLAFGTNDKLSLFYRLSNDAKLQVYSLKSPEILLNKKLLDDKVTSHFSTLDYDGLFALGLSNGQVQLQKLIFSENDQQKVRINFDVLARFEIANQAIKEISYALNESIFTLAALTENLLIITRWQDNQLISRQEITISADTKLQLSPNAKNIFLLSNTHLHVFNSVNHNFILRESINLANNEIIAPESISMLPNGMLLLGAKNGEKTLWFDALKENKRSLTLQFRFLASKQLTSLESFRNIFASLTENTLSLWHFPTQKEYKLNLGKLDKNALAMAFSPQGDSLLIEYEKQLVLFRINNPHPEINRNSLWKEIQYQGEAEPEYLWESGSNEKEGKFSLVPLILGSLKAAFYALLLATPIALGGAIFCAYFMPASLRKWIKPSVELINAFPTVILGFLASLVIAPWLEYHLLSFLVLFIVTPLCFFFLAVFWSKLPKYWKRKITASRLILFLIALILVLAFTVFSLCDFIILQYWNGDGQAFTNQILGTNIEQRNALVVGIAMGFAIIPTIFTIAENAIFSVPQHLTDASIALGATPWQTLTHVVLTTAASGIFSALIIGGSRAIGETIIVLMATGNTAIIDWNPLVGLRSLAANIAIEMPESLLNSSHFRVLFLTALLLFCFTFLFNTFAELVRERLRNKYRAL